MPRSATTRKPALRKPTVRKRKTTVRKKKALPKRKATARKKALPKRKATERKKALPKRKAKASTATVRQPRRPRRNKVATRPVTGSDDLSATRAILKEIAANQKKSDARQDRADARGEKIDARIDKTSANLDKALAKIDEANAKDDKRGAELDQLAKMVSRLGKSLGDIENRWGEFVEALLVGDAHEVLNGYRGIKVGPINPGFIVECDGKERELDGVCFGADMVVIIEAKSRLREGHIGKFIGDVLQRFIEMMPAFRGAKIYGAVGYLNADRETIEFAQKKGLIVLRTVHKTKEIIGEPSKYKLRNFHP